MTTTDPNRNYNNGSSYLVEAFRGMQTLGLSNDIEVVAGLIVDMVSGGIGFRNRTCWRRNPLRTSSSLRNHL
jgi:hypothetical protein